MDARKLQDLRNLGNECEEAADEIDRLTRELAEAKAQAVIPDGWVAVPAEPTREMVRAMGGECAFEEGQKWLDENARKEYRAMLSARPEFPKESSDVE